MKSAAASVLAAGVASACCIGPVVLVLVGAGAFGASLSAMEPYRPIFLAVTVMLLVFAFYSAYRPIDDCDEVCQPSARKRAQMTVWLAATLVLVLVLFPYYVRFLF